MRRTPCIPPSRAVRFSRRLLTLGFVGVLGLLTPIWAPTPPALAGEQAAIPLSQALDQLEAALTSLESAVPSQASPAAPSQPTTTASVASSPKDLIAEAQKLYERRLYGAAATLLGEQLARSTQLAQDPDALLLLGESLAELGDLRGAKSQLSTLIEKRPSDGRALIRLLSISTLLGSDPREKTWLAQLAALPAASQPEAALLYDLDPIVGKSNSSE